VLNLGFSAAAQLPPPRAARTPRSRGFFLAAKVPAHKRERMPGKARASIVALAVAVVAIASALIVTAPAAILGSAVNINPGPAMVGAASVAPAFLAPARTR
jgi:hypothetical protein